MSLRVILETDILRPLIDSTQGYGRMFKRLFAKQPIAASLVYNVVQGSTLDDRCLTRT